jgi:hypothetical protein
MKDLDFDELDRAVNSLMTNVPKSEPQTDDAPEKTLDIPSTPGSGTDLSFDKVTEAAGKAADAPEPKGAEKPAETPVSVPTRASAAAQHASRSMQAAAPTSRRAGRFMDVVHPSADMKKPDAPKPVSRQGVSLEPLSSPSQKIADVVPQKKDVKEIAPKSVVPAVDDKPEEKPTAAPVVLEAPAPPAPEEEPSASKSMSDWPDPLDMMTAAEPEKKEETEAPEEPKAEEIQPEVEPETAPAPLTSPFLPDAKVEKRPLGGIAPEEDAPVEDDMISRAPMADDTKKSVDDPNNQLPANPTAVEQALPEELSGDMMAVEADTTHAELKRTHDENQAETPPTPQEKPAVPKDSEPKETEPEPVADIENKPVSAGPTSIPQQYKEEPSTGDQDNGSIYDTDTYHQPLAHPAKKKSDWMWVLWIVLILALGAGGGALLFILKLV